MKCLALLLLALLPGCATFRTDDGQIDWSRIVAETELVQQDFALAAQVVQDDPELSEDLMRVSVNLQQVVDAMKAVRDGGNETSLEDSLQLLESLVNDQLQKATDSKVILGLYVVSRSIDRIRLRITAVE